MNYEEFYAFIFATQKNICQITALKDGVSIINDTWHDYKMTDTVHVMSATKSVVSLLIGIAFDKGLIKSMNQPVLDFFPDYTIKRGEKASGNVIYVNPEKAVVVAVTGTFKPTVFDRIDLIQKHIEPLLDASA